MKRNKSTKRCETAKVVWNRTINNLKVFFGVFPPSLCKQSALKISISSTKLIQLYGICCRYCGSSKASPICVEELSWFVHALISMSSKIISLSLNQICWKTSCAYSIVVCKCTGNCWDGNSSRYCNSNDTPPTSL